LGRGGPPGGPAAARRGRRGARRRARASRVDLRRRRARRGGADAALVTVAGAARALPLRDVRGARHREVRGRGGLRGAARADAARLALEGAGRRMTDFAVTRRAPALSWWGMAMFVAA